MTSVNEEISTENASKLDPIKALKSAEELFSARSDIEKLKAAVKLLSDARNPTERNYDVEWKFAKYSYFLGKALETEKDKNLTFETGRDAAKIASRIHIDRPDGHFWYAANLGELSQINPITVGLKSINDIRESMSKVVELDPSYQSASAFDALGQLELKTRSYGGTAKKAVEYLEKGADLSKTNANIRIHLAEAYIAVKRDADARKQIEALLKMEPNPEYVNEHEQAVAKAKKMLDRLS